MKVRAILLAFSALAGCASYSGASAGTAASGTAQAAPAAATPRDQIFPIVNAHTHLQSQRAVATITAQNYPPPVPAVTVPAEYDQLLRRREQASGRPPVGDLFTDDAIIVEMETGIWQQGHARIDRFLGFMWTNVRYVPNAYSMGDTTGYIAGTLRLGNNQNDFSTFLLGLRKSKGGKWQIAAETFNRIPPVAYGTPVAADIPVKQMDDAHIRYSVILAGGYWYSDPEGMRFENDWNIAEAARFPGRLIPFCGVNPLMDFAIAEVERCAKIPSVAGIKVHFANAGIHLDNPEHREKVRKLVAAVNKARLALVAHIRPIGNYKRVDVENFIKEILPAAPDIPVQIAHAANGPEALTVFAEAIEAGNPAVKNVIFDWGGAPPELLRRIGLNRIFFGTDMVRETGDTMLIHWDRIRKTSLTDDELRDIADNVPPYIK